MTRKDYILIAKELRKAYYRVGYREPTFLDAVNAVADAFLSDNARFDYARFKSEVFDDKNGGK